MNKVRIAVTGTGGGVGQSIIKSLADTDYDVVALDAEVLAAGLYAAKKSYIIPYASSNDFISRIIEICHKENCKFLFPGLDAELPVLTEASDLFKKAGVIAVVSSPEVIALGDDKLLTYETLTKHGISVPKTYDMAVTDPESLPLDYPYVLKIRIGGARSQNFHIVRDKKQLQSLISGGLDIKTYIAQEYIDGDEYTCGSINFDGECMGVIVMRRILRDGDTYKCFAVKDEAIEAEVRKILTLIKPYGACNVQLRIKNEKPYILEINARCSGTTAARALCGFNEPQMILDYLCHKQKPTFQIKEQTVLRYWQELVVSNDSIDQLEQTGELVQQVQRSL